MKKLYFNGDFLPMTNEGDSFEALVVEDGVIAFTAPLRTPVPSPRTPRTSTSTALASCPASSTRTAISPVPTSMSWPPQLENCKSFDEIVEAARLRARRTASAPIA
ncbi:MAG: hypothetical protein ACLTSX_10870 [Collinsella sp.]